MNKTLDEMKMIHEEEMQSYGRIQDRVISVMLSHGCKIVQTPSFEDYDSYGTYFPSLRKEMIVLIISLRSDGKYVAAQGDDQDDRFGRVGAGASAGCDAASGEGGGD